MNLSANDRRKIRKIIAVLTLYRDRYAKENDTGMSSKFARAMSILVDILKEDLKTGENYSMLVDILKEDLKTGENYDN